MDSIPFEQNLDDQSLLRPIDKRDQNQFETFIVAWIRDCVIDTIKNDNYETDEFELLIRKVFARVHPVSFDILIKRFHAEQNVLIPINIIALQLSKSFDPDKDDQYLSLAMRAFVEALRLKAEEKGLL